MGEPAIPTEKDRHKAIYRAREILQDIRDDVEHSYPRFRARVALIGIDAQHYNSEIDALIYRLSSTLDLVNTALQRACNVAEELNGDNGDDEELQRRKVEIAELRAIGVPVMFCAICGKRPAACIGRYEDPGPDEHACNHCCGHGNEDGHCKELDERPAIELEIED